MSGRSVGEIRLPVRPLYDAAGCTSAEQFAQMLGIERHSVFEAFRTGWRLAVAEDRADRLGLHPTLVWGDVYRRAVTEHAMWQQVKYARKLAVNRAAHARKRSAWRTREQRAWVEWCNQNLDPDSLTRRPHQCATDGCRCTEIPR